MTIAPSELLLLNFLVEDKKPGVVALDPLLGRALRALRSHLALETAFISHGPEGGRVIRFIDSVSDNPHLRAGSRDPFSGLSALDGQIVNGARAHVSVPVLLDDAREYGCLTCIGAAPESPFTARDLSLIRVFAEFAAELVEADMYAGERDDELRAKVQGMIDGDSVSFMYQPIYDLNRARVAGFEALARFAGTPARAPDVWFADAARVGLDGALQHKLIRKAVESFEQLPGHVYVGFNVSPNILLHIDLKKAFADMPLERVVLELNEHLTIRQYDEITKVLGPMREHGLRISVDDAGGGVQSFRHILQLKPDIIKLHMSLVRNIHQDAARRAMAAALIQFGKDHRCDVVAEGIETASELSMLKAMSVVKMQGYLLGRPTDLTTAATLCERGITRRVPARPAATV